MLEFLPQWFQIFFFSMVPWLEARYVIPFSMIQYGWEWWRAFPLAVVGNMLPVPFILLFFSSVERFLRRYPFWSRIMDWLFKWNRKKAGGKIRKYKYLGLLVFVAVPIPFTGAWTGSLIAYLFNLKFSRSVFIIFIGVVCAALIMIAITLYARWMLTFFNVNV
jgi:uncharacterized membrane protein